MDALDVIKQKIDPNSIPPAPPVVKAGTVLIHMRGSTGSWETPSGVKFTKKSPYQVVPEHEANMLLDLNRFEPADPESVKKFFGI